MRTRVGRVGRFQLSVAVLAAFAATGVAGQARQTPRTDFGSALRAAAADPGAMYADATALAQQIEDEMKRSASSAQTFGSRLTAAERRELQAACEAAVASEGDARAQTRLQSLLARYEETEPETMLRFCLDRSYTRLRNEIATTVGALERMQASGAEAQANIEMQNSLQRLQRTFTTLSNVMKTKHDTAKNSISNVR